MLRPTNDPMDVMRREQAKLARDLRDANAADGTQNYQAVRKLEAAVSEIRELVIRMPTNDGRQIETDDWRGGSGWRTVLSTSIPRPSDKSRVVVSATGFLTAIAGGDLLAFTSRIVVNGVPSIEFIGTVEGSAFITRSTSYPSFVREISPLTASSVSVQLQVGAPAAYDADTRASLSVMAGFSTI